MTEVKKVMSAREMGLLLKSYMNVHYGVKVRVRGFPMSRKFDSRWYEVWVESKWSEEGALVCPTPIPNVFLLEVAETIFPEFDVKDKDNVGFGNVHKNHVSLMFPEWMKVLGIDGEE